MKDIYEKLISAGLFDLAEEFKSLAGINDPHILKAIFMAGGPGSGKSYVSENMFAGLGLKWLAPDRPFEHMLLKKGLSLKIDPSSKEQMDLRELALQLTDLQESHWVNGMLGLLYDGTGQNYDKIKAAKERIENIGYDTGMVFINTSLEVAQERNALRTRSLAPEVVEEVWKKSQANLGRYQSMFGLDSFVIVDNNEVLEGAAAKRFGTSLRKKALKLLNQPLKNPIGKNLIALMKKTGAKTLGELSEKLMAEAA